MFKVNDRVVRKGGNDIGYVVEPIHIIEGLALVKFEGGESVESISDLRLFKDSFDEYEDMYCEVCGGTACMC